MKKVEIILQAKENPKWKKQFGVVKTAIDKLNKITPLTIEEVQPKKKK